VKPLLPLFVFIDACGWEIVKHDPFALELAPHRRQLESVFGYSSACVPSILSGHWPVEHRNWCYFVYDPVHSPFRVLRPLRWLPRFLTSRRFFRRRLSRFMKSRLGFKGYFDLYNLPFRHIHLFDFSEKKSPLQPGGMNRGTNIFDFLQARRIPYHVSDPEGGELDNLRALQADIAAETIDFAFLYWPGLDGLLHQVGNDSPQIPDTLRGYEAWIAELMATATAHYEEVRLYVFSDHGMANCDQIFDLQAHLRRAISSRMPRDFVAVYDSTMARFWFKHPRARSEIEQALSDLPVGRVLPDDELDSLGALFPDRYFGELIFLVREGVLIVPSHMGERPIRAMHGYHPRDPQSYALLATNHQHVPENVRAIPEMCDLMTRDATLAYSLNHRRTETVVV
jgi:predicted AlkP superfamily pyrophosphatase or phosphodiesterase